MNKYKKIFEVDISKDVYEVYGIKSINYRMMLLFKHFVFRCLLVNKGPQTNHSLLF
jgi:hypothetical protein